MGIDYWRDIGTDVYDVDLPSFICRENLRECLKTLLLVALNAKDERSTFMAFRCSFEHGHPLRRLTDKKLSQVLELLRTKHSPIRAAFASGVGVDLMHTDSLITEIILKHFTRHGIPVLSVHDSYIIAAAYKDDLEHVMREAFQRVTGGGSVRLKMSQRDPDPIIRSPRYRRNLEVFQGRVE